MPCGPICLTDTSLAMSMAISASLPKDFISRMKFGWMHAKNICMSPKLRADASVDCASMKTAHLVSAWPDGIAFDSSGNLWGTMVYSDKLFVLTPQGDLRVLLDEGDPQKVDALERAKNALSSASAFCGSALSSS